MTVAALERYRPIVDDADAFFEAAARPLPICVWANTARTTPERLGEWMAGGGFSFRQLPWYPGAFELPPEVSPGNRLEFLAGLYHVQEEVSLLPVVLLDPQPGERVLDLCSAPGNKTAQISLRVGLTGTVVANDRHYSRLAILRRNVDRLGLANSAVTLHDAASYPKAAGLFDRVLVDVPCSCEGNSRKFPLLLAKNPDAARPGRLAGAQSAMLRKAVELVRPGGRIVYSTCTYAPEENEAVVDAVLGESGDVLRLLPARVEGFPASPGLVSWQGVGFAPEMSRCLRAWPHHNDTGGFFVAVLEKTRASGLDAPAVGSLAESAGSETPRPLSPQGRQRWTGPLIERFGFDEDLFTGYALYGPGRKHLSLATANLEPPIRPTPHALGLPLVRTDMRHPKLASGAALLFGAKARHNTIQVSREQANAFAGRRDFVPEPEQAGRCAPGYVLVRHQEVALGVGFLPAEEGAAVRSLFPKAWSLAPERSLF